MKALVIDDNKQVTDSISDFLTSIEIDCTAVNSGAKGLALLTKEKYDIILLDLAMPDFSGFDVLIVLKDRNLIRSNNIIIITAVSLSYEVEKEILESGVREIMMKPMGLEQLVELVRSYDPVKKVT
jgi:two-component system, OmpR family, response regulator